MSEQTLSSIFSKRTFTHKLKWNAYPVLNPTSEFPPIRIHQKLFYMNSVETGLSVIDMSALQAKNIANMIEKEWISLRNEKNKL